MVEFSLRKGAQTMSSKNKHMTLENRLEIQECLNNVMTFKAIVRRIGKNPITVSKEVKLHLETHQNGHYKSGEVCRKLLKASFV